MVRTMLKSSLREIRQSLGRYLAILSIVALGVGLFAGLMVSTPDMIRAGGDYMNENDLYDVRLVSTLGFDRDAVELVVGIDGLKAAEGAVSTDFLAVDYSGEELVLTAQTQLEVQNRVVLISGRMPEAADECVVDADAFPEEAVGTVLTVSDNNEEKTQDLFSGTEYKIVGRVNASAYVNNERGTSTLGNGRIRGFVYLPADGFTDEYYTEIFLRMDRDYVLYSDEYETAAEDLEDRAEPVAKEAAMQRYEDILSEAQTEIEDAEAELEEETGKAKKELEDARIELEDGEKEIQDGKTQLADAEAQLDSSREEIESGWQELAQNERELADGRSQAQAGQQQLSQARGQLEAAIAALDASGSGQDPALTAQRSALQAQLDQILQQEAGLQAQLDQIAAGEAALEEGRRQLADAEAQLEEAQQEIDENRQEIEDARQELADGWQEYEDGQKELEEETADARQEIKDAKEELAELEEPEVYVLGRDANLGYGPAWPAYSLRFSSWWPHWSA